MSRMVMCRKFGEELEGLDVPPMPGAKGQDLFDNVSKKAWGQWQHLQTMLINEKHLNLRDADARKYLGEQMARFFANEAVDDAEGYVPPEQGDP